MLKLIEKKRNAPLRRCSLTAGQRVSRKYRRANIRRIEYKKLKAIVPSIATKNRVTKVEVIEEAIKYIDELHQALYSRVPHIYGNGLPPFLPEMSPECALAHLLRQVSPPSAPNTTTSSLSTSYGTRLSTSSSSTHHPYNLVSQPMNHIQSKELPHQYNYSRPMYHQTTSTYHVPTQLRQASTCASTSTTPATSSHLINSHRGLSTQSRIKTNSISNLL